MSGRFHHNNRAARTSMAGQDPPSGFERKAVESLDSGSGRRSLTRRAPGCSRNALEVDRKALLAERKVLEAGREPLEAGCKALEAERKAL
jgi:hypothetical protein